MNRIIVLGIVGSIGAGGAGGGGQIDPESNLAQTESALAASPIDRVDSLNRADTWMHPAISYSNDAGSAPAG
jgi:hypothetical protein